MIEYEIKLDRWYKRQGVKPPERQSHGITEEDIEERIQEAGKHQHKWLQKGPYIFCTAGGYEHGNNVGVDRRLTGTDKDGMPVLEEI